MKLFLVVLLLSSFCCLGKDSVTNLSGKKTTVTKNHTGTTDTVKYPIEDSVYLSLPASKSATPVYIIQQASKSSPFKDVLPILTLVLGIAINKVLDWFKDKKKINKVGERWVAEIRGIESPIAQQIDLLKESLKKERENKYSYSNLPVVSTLDCEIFKSLDKSDLLKFIERHNKNNYHETVLISNQTHGFISILVRLHTTLEEKYNDFLKGTSHHTTTVNENLQDLGRNFAYYQVELEKELGHDPIKDPRYRPILDLYDKYIEPHRKDGAFDLFLLDDLFFEPLTKIFAILRHDERTKGMADATLGCVNGIKGIRMEKHYWAENIEEIIRLYQDQLNALPTIANRIENRTV